MLCAGVWSSICLLISIKLTSVNGICLHLCPVSVSYAYKLYSFTKLVIGIVIPDNIPSSFDGFLDPDFSKMDSALLMV